MAILSINDVSKSYGKIKALQHLTLDINKGEIFGLLGPNGSGKTTTLGIILGILSSDSGSFDWFDGKYGIHHRKHIGAVLETPNFYSYLNAEQNLAIVAQIKHSTQSNFNEILELIGLKHRATSKFSTYSLGMKQRLAIGATLIGDPDVLIFDEPTNGLDPQGIVEVREVIKRLATTGKTIIMASHMLDEVEKICSHLAILKSGRLLASGTVGTLLNDDLFAEIGAEDNEQLKAFIDNHENMTWLKTTNGIIECQINKEITAAQLNAICYASGITLTHLVVRKRKLEEEFLAITNKIA